MCIYKVQRIRQSTKPEQWFYVATEHNPADHVFTSISSSHLAKTTWFRRPTLLLTANEGLLNGPELINPELDVVLLPDVSSFHTEVQA